LSLRPSFLRHALDGVDDDAQLTAFLRDYWRQQPLALPKALESLHCPLDADELAGIACEADADARIVRTTDEGFALEQGPFDAQRFAELGDANWTLLVNGVDLFVAGFEPWLEAARFVPDWRLDDVMVSFAAPGGSVGPHLDRYDVFLLQATGERSWALGPDPARESRTPQLVNGLLLVDSFTPHRTLICGEGDGLYVPAGCVHHGVARTPSVTVSIGFRAPSLPTLVDGWFDHLLDGLDDAPLDLDPRLPAVPGRLDGATVDAARQALREAIEARLSGAGFAHALGCLLTEPQRGADVTPVSEPQDSEALAAALRSGARLERAPGVRLLIHEAEGAGSHVFCTGEVFPREADAAALSALTSLTPLGPELCEAPHALELASELYNRGMLRWVEES